MAAAASRSSPEPPPAPLPCAPPLPPPVLSLLLSPLLHSVSQIRNLKFCSWRRWWLPYGGGVGTDGPQRCGLMPLLVPPHLQLLRGRAARQGAQVLSGAMAIVAVLSSCLRLHRSRKQRQSDAGQGTQRWMLKIGDCCCGRKPWLLMTCSPPPRQATVKSISSVGCREMQKL